MLEGLFAVLFLIGINAILIGIALFVRFLFIKIKDFILEKNIGSVIVLFLSVLLIIFFNMGINLDKSISTDDISNTADGFTIEEYKVKLIVDEDNKVDVTEYITVNWISDFHHGIYKFTAEWLEYTAKDGKTIKRKSKVRNLTALDDPYTTDMVKKKARIKIGSSAYYVPLGKKQYVINYIYDMGSDPYKGFDEFIFHAFGDYWGTRINNPSIEVTFPKSIDSNNVRFFTDKYRNEDITSFVDYKVTGNTLYAKLSSDFYLAKSLTLDVELPNNYFKRGSNNYSSASLIVIIIITLITIYTYFKWKMYGKDYKKGIKTVEFYPPCDYNAAEVGYIYGNKLTKKLTIALIVQLASKGYIKIDELKDKKKNIQVTNIYPTPTQLEPFEKELPPRVIEVRRLKTYDFTLSKSAITMMVHMFKKGNIKRMDTNIDKFLNVRDELVNGGFIEILNDNEKTRVDDYELRKKEYEEKEIQYKKDMEIYANNISKLKPLTELENYVYEKLFESNNVVIISEHHTLYQAFLHVDYELKYNLSELIDDNVAKRKMISSIFITILVFVLHFVGYSILEDLNPSLSFLYNISYICIFINVFLTFFMRRKTKYGEEIKSKIDGFRDFLINVEKDKLEELVLENPQYFYDILPYTYVLNISKKWIEKFENIEIPEMDMGTLDYNNTKLLYTLSSDVYYPHSSGSGSSSSGCSSCGGGCSSCGGGCSSCGGGGSW